MAGGKWCTVFLIVILVLITAVESRTVPNEIKGTLNDQKNLITFGGIGGYSGIGSNGLPVGGFGGGAGIIGDLGGGGLGGGGGAGTGLGLGLGGNGGVPFP